MKPHTFGFIPIIAIAIALATAAPAQWGGSGATMERPDVQMRIPDAARQILPDLAITSTEGDVVGDRIRLRVTVVNRGLGPYTPSNRCSAYLAAYSRMPVADNARLAIRPIPALAPRGGSTVIEMEVRKFEGTVTVHIQPDINIDNNTDHVHFAF
ncbi:hypothetical protein TVNIR_3352 [Thioalkalivibrio nitratireducens DSM 14787]|uniref:CARDB domain-containing protein n=1 Tax=Thioalkalivibrio nitratireducens (strain DSM 14787 / UNIQEM 213 / ALEN2) TaxID=1255043 RepID=L0E115_THIND|nr:hypothetical protein [Thioalkalivibrio nitratireducens]AGA34988.1 hypothetical protein TVNIR_3352 [Thioalkalivibrio nitratireducens DSM 14787]